MVQVEMRYQDDVDGGGVDIVKVRQSGHTVVAGMYPAIEQYRRAAEGKEMTGSADLLTGAQGRDGHDILAHDDYTTIVVVVYYSSLC